MGQTAELYVNGVDFIGTLCFELYNSVVFSTAWRAKFSKELLWDVCNYQR